MGPYDCADYISMESHENITNHYKQENAQLKAELAQCQDRCRIATQMIIGEIGAYGPESLESAIGRIVAKLTSEQQRAARLREALQAIVYQYDYEGQEYVTEETIGPARKLIEEDQA